ncbi:zinc finger protein OZF-like [Battus philenor]|uniref:zinc finger protein OZF-like n=1 Tax=Battus philenor TaxID=42288 RepID=UPI0035CE9DA3
MDKTVSEKKPIREYKKHQENLKCILQYSNASMIRGKDAEGYGCNFCPKRFPIPHDLKSHFLLEHNKVSLTKLPKFTDYLLKLDITHLKCRLCEKLFSSLDSFCTHLGNDHKKILHTDIKNEIIPFKFESETLQCAVCSAIFTNFKILQEHMHVHFSNYQCEVCCAGFISRRRLVGHQRRHGNTAAPCSHCAKVFSCDQKRRDHEQRIHLGLKKRNKCRFCDEKFADYWTKVDHMVKEHGLPRVVLKCQACDRTFENKRALTRHVKKDHLMERKHVCNVCDMRFYLKHRLKDHMLVHSGEKQFQCHVCSRWYATKKSVRQHLRSHADDRRHACTLCVQAFVQQNTLKNHMRAKHDEKLC